MNYVDETNVLTAPIKGFSVAEGRQRLNLVGVTGPEDSLIQVSLMTALQIAENYCHRRFPLAVETAVQYHLYGDAVNLPRYPIQSINKVKVNGSDVDPRTVHIVGLSGQVRFHRHMKADVVEITYEGGYDPLPGDLLIALWGIFDTVYANLKGSGGSFQGATGGISSINVPDVGSISFSQGGASGVTSGKGDAVLGSPYGAFLILLDSYKEYSC
jgi:hypothetical protein